MLRKTIPMLVLGLALGVGGQQRPNVLLILADDMGFSDLGSYGGEIRTPNLDSLATGGVRFTQFYNSSRCVPSRGSLLTGLYPHQTGLGEMTSDAGAQFPGYRGTMNNTSVTLAEVLRGAGYGTYHAGKWHVGNVLPTARGFDEFYGFHSGYGVDSWNEDMMTRLPAGRTRRTYAPGTYYATDAVTDYALDFMQLGRDANKPWFLYLAYQVPHFPVQAPLADINAYNGIYDVGWDAIRQQRLQRMIQLGIVPAGTTLSVRDSINAAWTSLPANRRADLARRMAVYAAMVERMDRNIGRVVADLKARGEFNNTLIFFLSDNGACGEWTQEGFDFNMTYPWTTPGVGINVGTPGFPSILHSGTDLAQMGGPAASSLISYGSGWANACNAPLRKMKHYTYEGGVRTPFFIHYPARVSAPGRIANQMGHLVDIMSTVVQITGATYPQAYQGHLITPMEGLTLSPLMANQNQTRNGPYFYEHEGHRGIREGRWKLVSPRVNQPWQLFDMQTDLIESLNLAGANAATVTRLAGLYDDWAVRAYALKVPTFIPTRLKIVSPNGGEIWPPGSSRNIVWGATTDSVVNISLFYNTGAGWQSLISEPHTGTYAWTVPNVPSPTTLVRIISANGRWADTSDAYFTIGTPVPALGNRKTGGRLSRRARDKVLFQVPGGEFEVGGDGRRRREKILSD